MFNILFKLAWESFNDVLFCPELGQHLRVICLINEGGTMGALSVPADEGGGKGAHFFYP